MPSKKKSAETKVEKVDTEMSNPVHGPNDAVTAQGTPDEKTESVETRASAYQSDHFTVLFKDQTAYIAPLNWVGPAPLAIPESRLEELRDLLGEATE